MVHPRRIKTSWLFHWSIVMQGPYYSEYTEWSTALEELILDRNFDLNSYNISADNKTNVWIVNQHLGNSALAVSYMYATINRLIYMFTFE